MKYKKYPRHHDKQEQPGKNPEIRPVADPGEPTMSQEEEPDLFPEEDPFRTPPYEMPSPGEGP